MEEKRYLTGRQKIAYGAGDFGSNFMYTFVSSFVLIYLTDTVGLNAGVIGTLMLLSKCLDGVTDVFFGRLIDRTKNKMGKARPWMLWSTFPLAICEILLFITPNVGQTIQYAYFFIVYTLLSAIFYTANNISYASLVALITKNPHERVQAGTYRFMFAMLAGIVISSVTTLLVDAFGGGVAGWRGVAILYTLIMVLFNLLAVFSVKEITEEDEKVENSKGISFIQSIKLLVTNKYYLLILAFYLLQYGMQGITNGTGIFFCTYSLNNAEALGLFSFSSMIPMIVGLAVTPTLVKKWGIYKVNRNGMIFSAIFGLVFIAVGYTGNLVLMLVVSALRGLGMSPLLGTMNAVIADTSAYSYKKDGVHLDGTMFSCSSMGIKLGGGIGTAACGWLLALGGYQEGGVAEQTAGAIGMIEFMYIVIPAIVCVLMLLVVWGLNIDKGMKALEDKK